MNQSCNDAVVVVGGGGVDIVVVGVVVTNIVLVNVRILILSVKNISRSSAGTSCWQW